MRAGCEGGHYPFLTQKERDIETALDYFGARYYASAQGRFTGADPLLSSGRLEDPQTWNRYSYTLNNPLCLLDPTGMFTISSSVKDQADRNKIIGAYNKLNEALTKLTRGSKAYKSIERSLARLGKPGEANGVVVTIGTVNRPDANAETDPGEIAKGTVTIRFNKDKFGSGTAVDLAGSLGHEGVHADDIFKLWAEKKTQSGFDAVYNSNDFNYRMEYDARFANAGVAQALDPTGIYRLFRGRYEVPAGPGKARNLPEYFDLWNPSWKTLDIKEIEAKQSYSTQTHLEAPRTVGGYGLKRPLNFKP